MYFLENVHAIAIYQCNSRRCQRNSATAQFLAHTPSSRITLTRALTLVITSKSQLQPAYPRFFVWTVATEALLQTRLDNGTTPVYFSFALGLIVLLLESTSRDSSSLPQRGHLLAELKKEVLSVSHCVGCICVSSTELRCIGGNVTYALRPRVHWHGCCLHLFHLVGRRKA